MNRRLVPIVAAIAAASGVVAMLSPSAVALLVGGLAILAVVGLGAVRRRAGAEDRWIAPSPGFAGTAAPGAAPLSIAGAGRHMGHPGSSMAVTRALGRVESRELATSPWFGAGIGLLFAGYFVLAVVFGGDNGGPWRETLWLVTWFAHPLAGIVVIAVHRAATRPERDGTAELFAACPTSTSRRHAALVWTAPVPLASFAAFAVLFGVTLLVRCPWLHGSLHADAVPVVLSGAVLLVGAVVLGVTLASWFRWAVTPLVAVVAVGFVSLRLFTFGDPGWNRLGPLSTLGGSVASPLLYPLLRTWAWLGWLIVLTVLVGLIGRLRFRRDAATWTAFGATAVLAAVVAVRAVAPADAADGRAVAALITEPAAHQRCTSVGDGNVRVCTYPGYGELRDRIAASVGPVVAAAPLGALDLTMRQGLDAGMGDLPPVVRAHVDHLPIAGSKDVPIGYAADPHELLAYRFRVALVAMGVQVQDGDFGDPLPLAGEARGVAALWLGTRGLTPSDALALAEEQEGADAFERGLAWPTMCGPVVWAPQDLAAARALIGLPDARVRAVLAADLDRWTDPATRTDELLAALELASTGPVEPVTSRTEPYC